MKSHEMGVSLPEEPEEEKTKSKYIIGGIKNLDGTISNGLSVIDPKMEKQLDENFAAHEQRIRLERAKKLEIPADVKPGTSDAVWYTLRNALIVCEEATEKAGSKNQPEDIRKTELAKRLKIEQSILANFSRGNQSTPLEMSDAIQKFFEIMVNSAV